MKKYTEVHFSRNKTEKAQNEGGALNAVELKCTEQTYKKVNKRNSESVQDDERI